MVKFQHWAATALVIGFTFVVAACGGDDDEKAPKLEEPKPAARPSKPEPPLDCRTQRRG